MSLYELHDRPELHQPVLVTAPEGWIDAGLGGGAAVATLLAEVPTEIVATFDVDDLLDHRARRPVARIVDGVYEGLEWPEILLRAGHDSQGHGVLVLTGPEPDHQWRAYAAAVGELAVSFGVRMLVGLGAFPAPVPHTRAGKLAATASAAELTTPIGVVSGTVEVPAGVLVAIEHHFTELGIPAMGLWARVPHYAATMPYPEASALLLDGLATVSGIRIDTTELREAADATRQRLDLLTENSVQHTAMVRQLEAQVDQQQDESDSSWGNLPSGDDLVAEVERYLRDQPQ